MGHLIVATPNISVETYPGDILGPLYHTHRIVRQPLDIDCPTITIPDRPGLGVELDFDTIERLKRDEL